MALLFISYLYPSGTVVSQRYLPGKGVIGLLWSSLNVWRPSPFSFWDFLSVTNTHLELWYQKAQIRAWQRGHRVSSLNVWRLSNYFYLEVFVSVAYTRRTIDDLIEEILAELHNPAPEGPQFTDLDDQVPPSVRLPADQWVEILNDAKDEFEVYGASAVFSTWREEEDDPLKIGDIEIARRHACQSRQVGPKRLDDRLQGYPTSSSSPRGQFYSETHGSPWERWWLGPWRQVWSSPDWAKEEPGVIEISRDTKPGVLTGIVSVFYQNVYPVTAVAYGLYHIRGPDPANLAPLTSTAWHRGLWNISRASWEARDLHPHGDRKYRGGRRECTKVVQLLTTWLNWKRSSSGRSSWQWGHG